MSFLMGIFCGTGYVIRQLWKIRKQGLRLDAPENLGEDDFVLIRKGLMKE